ncbi:MAG: M1 family aminopeptidase [Bacteroidota bacterium]
MKRVCKLKYRPAHLLAIVLFLFHGVLPLYAQSQLRASVTSLITEKTLQETLPAIASARDDSLIQHPIFSAPLHEPITSGFDQEHIRLALRFEPEAGRIFGVAKLRIRPSIDSLNTLRLAADGIEVYGVQVGVLDSLKIDAPYADTADGLLDVQLDSLQVRGVPFEIQITYRANPKAGMYFRDVNKADTSHQVHIWTDGTNKGNSYWIPLLNNPTDRLTSEIIATLPPALDVLSNGRKTEQMETDDGMSLFHFVQDQSHNPADIGLYVGRFQKATQTIRLKNGFSVGIEHWTAADQAEAAATSLQEIPDILFFLSDKLDFTYPWPGYTQLIFKDEYLPDLSYTGFTVFNDRILVDERAQLDQANTLQLATNLAKQWYGHLISIDHWSDVWLTESLSSFLGLMFLKSTQGDATYYSHLHQLAGAYFDEAASYQRPLVWNQWYTKENLLDNHTHAKGVWFFHALMSTMGEEQFWEFLQSFTRTQAFQTTNTDKLLNTLTQASGEPFDAFFDHWLYSAGHPAIDLNYQYDLVSESLYVSVEQLQEGYLVPPVFQLDVPIETYSLAGPTRTPLQITDRDQLFSLPLTIQPRYVQLDPDNTLLSNISVTQSANAWVSQLRYASHPLSQLTAVQALEAYADDPALFIGLQSALKSRPIPIVRAAIIKLIAKLPPSDATKRTLLETYDADDSPLVKQAVLTGLEKFEDKADLTILAMEAAQAATSYHLQAQAVMSLIKIQAPNAEDLLQSALITPSYKDLIRQAALRSVQYTAMNTRDRVKLATDFSRPSHAVEVRFAAMEILAELAALENKRSRSALLDLLDDNQVLVRKRAAKLIGTLGQPDDLKSLEKRLNKEFNPFVIDTLKDAIRALSPASEATASM